MFFRVGERQQVVEVRGRIYAVGDIHGRLDLLRLAVERIEAHAGGRPKHLLFLGDYVDRGPDSRGVVELVMALEQAGEATCLKGNHENMMALAVRDRGVAVARWLDMGGDATLRSYGLKPRGPASPLLEAHAEWMAGLPLVARDRHRIYVHAGLVPGRPAERQSARTCLWIRERFLEAAAEDLPGHVVHGHTPVWQGKPDLSRPELLAHRTNLDTGAYRTGVLTVAVFEPEGPPPPAEVLTIHSE
jgi:serine/threonine protein phosphatase 1